MIGQLEQATGQRILVNWSALEQVHVTKDLPVTIDLSGVSLGDALTRLLDDVGGTHTCLVYVVDKDSLVVTTCAELSKNVVTCVYDVRGTTGKEAIGTVVRRLRGIDPLSWSETGGYGHIDVFNGQLIVTQTPDMQQRIAQELNYTSPGKVSAPSKSR